MTMAFAQVVADKTYYTKIWLKHLWGLSMCSGACTRRQVRSHQPALDLRISTINEHVLWNCIDKSAADSNVLLSIINDFQSVSGDGQGVLAPFEGDCRLLPQRGIVVVVKGYIHGKCQLMARLERALDFAESVRMTG